MQRKLKIGLDFDGVVSDCGDMKSWVTKEMYGLDIPPARFKKEIIIGEGILTAEEYALMQQVIYASRSVGLMMPTVQGAAEYIPRFIAEGHDLSVVTSRKGIELEVAMEWDDLQGFNLGYVGVGYGISKAEALAGFDVYIDDDFDKLGPIVNTVPHRFLFSWGYNEHIEVGTVARRVASWEAFYQAVQLLH